MISVKKWPEEELSWLTNGIWFIEADITTSNSIKSALFAIADSIHKWVESAPSYLFHNIYGKL